VKLRVRSTEDHENAELLRLQLAAADQARDMQSRRREALIDCVVSAVPAALLKARNAAWDEGYEAACRGLPKTANPARPLSN
jgi:hypothetical protein